MLMSWKFWMAMTAIMGVVGLLAFGFTQNPRIVQSPLVEGKAPSFDLVEMNTGERLSSDDLKGTPYLLNFWASWCEACKTEAPYLKAAYEFYEKRSGGKIRVIGIAIQDTLKKARAFAKRYGKNYFLAMDNEQGEISLNFGLYGVPETFFIDRAGIIRFKQIGALTPGVIDREFAKFLTKPTSTPSQSGDGSGPNEALSPNRESRVKE